MLYHKSPSVLATIFDILKGQFITMRIARRLKAEILHVRSYIPAPLPFQLKDSQVSNYFLILEAFGLMREWMVGFGKEIA